MRYPTAMHDEAEKHEIPLRVPVVLGTVDHVDPFHCSMRFPPTAMQNEAEVQVIP
jgi:hypothetical protein